MFHAPVLAAYAKPRLSKCPNTADGASAVRPWIFQLFTWSGLLLTALVSLVHGMRVRPSCIVSRTYRSLTYLLSLFKCHEDHRSFRLFKYFWFEHALKPARWPHFAALPLPVQLLGSAHCLSLDALSMVLLFCGKRLGGGVVSFGWGPHGGLPILVSGNLDAPARDTGCLHRCPCHFVPVDDNLCFHSWGKLRLGDPPGILGLET
jgi:hypothetical protein